MFFKKLHYQDISYFNTKEVPYGTTTLIKMVFKILFNIFSYIPVVFQMNKIQIEKTT